MSDMEFENKLRSIAQGMEYPHTPNIAGSVTARLRSSTRPRFSSKALAWSLTIIILLCSSLMLIPPVRAAILEFIQIGVIRIFPRSVEPTVEPIVTATPDHAARSEGTVTPNESSASLLSLLDQIAGETELATAREITPYPILLPTYPANLGQPDRIYVQEVDGVMTILVWIDPQQPGRVTMSLHFIPAGHWAINKFGPMVIQETQVNGQRALWAEGPYPLVMKNRDMEVTRMIDGHVLIWSQGDITYRLETDQSLEEAVNIAESLEPIQ
jgi:hypothetical protein